MLPWIWQQKDVTYIRTYSFVRHPLVKQINNAWHIGKMQMNMSVEHCVCKIKSQLLRSPSIFYFNYLLYSNNL
jgi:hypothetical protein